jgi:transcriptional regulator PpsR
MTAMTQGISDHAPRHFNQAQAFLADLDADVAAELITAAADVVMILDGNGIIRDVAVGSEELIDQGCHEWLGKAWHDIVTPESQDKVCELLRDPSTPTGAGTRWRHLNHALPSGGELPISYSVLPLRQGLNGGGERRIAFGRDLRPQVVLQQRLVSAQLSMERDYWRLRQVETRYRLLFQMASEPLLILENALDRLEEANPAAQALFGEGLRSPGWDFTDQLDKPSQAAVRQMIERLKATGRADPIQIRLADGGLELMLFASQFRQDKTLHYLLRMSRRQDAAAPPLETGRQQLMQVMESAPDALVVTDLEGRILSANRAFLDLGQLVSEEQARGRALDHWLGRTGVDFRVLLTNLRQHGSVRLFATQMRGEYGSTTEVEVSAVAANAGPQRCLGFTIRDMQRRLVSEGRTHKELPRSASQMTELVGRMPLKDIVRETTDLIEQLCIEAALELTGDNRASAAEMLGLSRQSLYIKLRKFGLIESGVGSDDGLH